MKDIELEILSTEDARRTSRLAMERYLATHRANQKIMNDRFSEVLMIGMLVWAIVLLIGMTIMMLILASGK